MNKRILEIIKKIGSAFCTIALSLTVMGAGNTCVFMTYQPEFPDELTSNGE